MVLVTASTSSHVELALQAARHGCHLFVEKPLSYTIDARLFELLDEVEKRGLINMVGCNMRYHPGPVAVKELLQSKFIGDTIAARIHAGSYLPHWHPGSDYRKNYSASPASGGAVLDCIHEIDLAIWYFGPAKLVGAAGIPAVSIGLQTDGMAEILLRHESGVLSSLHLNFLQRDYKRSCQVIGSEGTIYWDFKKRQIKVFGDDGELMKRQGEPDGWQLNQMYVEEIKDFLQSVETLRPPVNSISNSLDTLKIALAVKSKVTEAS